MNEDINNFPNSETERTAPTNSGEALSPAPSKSKKPTNPYLISTIVLAVLLIGAGGYITYDALTDKKQDDTTQEVKPAPEVDQSEPEADTAEYINLNLAPENDLDASEEDEAQVELTPNDFAYGISLIKEDDKNIKLSYIPDRLVEQNLLDDAAAGAELKTVTLSAPSEIQSLEIADFDQSLSTPRIIATLENGQLAWISYDEIFNQNKTELSAIKDVEQVVKLQSVNAKSEDNSFTDTIAIRNDGKYYRLSNYLPKVEAE